MNIIDRLNFSTTDYTNNAIEIKKWGDVNHVEILSLYLLENDICESDDDFDSIIDLMKDFGQNDKSFNTYFFWIDKE
ncbi:MAG: hypothetical protein HOG49_21730 [Candidatus Scalindua sp.]|nr:hypothetical protein [Candidatus Scalindua sp.]